MRVAAWRRANPRNAIKAPDNGLPTPAGHGPGDFHVVTFESVGGFLGDAIKHFLEGDLLDGKGQLEFGEVTEMGRGPGGLSGVTEGYGGGETFLTRWRERCW